MSAKKSQLDVAIKSPGLEIRSRRLISLPQEDRISDSAKATRIEIMIELNSKSEMARPPSPAGQRIGLQP